ncbi:hypothetical protein D3C72_2059100 [compost metagenome]
MPAEEFESSLTSSLIAKNSSKILLEITSFLAGILMGLRKEAGSLIRMFFLEFLVNKSNASSILLHSMVVGSKDSNSFSSVSLKKSNNSFNASSK